MVGPDHRLFLSLELLLSEGYRYNFIWQLRKNIKMKLETSLQKIAIYTAVPADLLAILPAIYWLWTKIVNPDNQAPLSLEVNIGFDIPIRDITYVLIFYSFVAYMYWVVKSYKLSFVRNALVGISLFLAFPLVLALTTFGILAFSDGLAIAILCLVTTVYFWRQFVFNLYTSTNDRLSLLSRPIRMVGPTRRIDPYITDLDTAEFQDVGVWYFLWTPLIWLIFQIENPMDYWKNFIWALLYSAIGYLLSLIFVWIMSNIWQRWRGGYSYKKRDPSDNILYFNPARIVISISKFGKLFLIVSNISLYIILGFTITSSLLLRIFWIGLPIVLITLLITLRIRSLK
jgi:hypothetical protein